MILLIYILVFVASSFICFRVAKSRGANKRFWVYMGAIFGPLAIPFVFFSKRGNEANKGLFDTISLYVLRLLLLFTHKILNPIRRLYTFIQRRH